MRAIPKPVFTHTRNGDVISPVKHTLVRPLPHIPTWANMPPSPPIIYQITVDPCMAKVWTAERIGDVLLDKPGFTIGISDRKVRITIGLYAAPAISVSTIARTLTTIAGVVFTGFTAFLVLHGFWRS